MAGLPLAGCPEERFIVQKLNQDFSIGFGSFPTSV